MDKFKEHLTSKYPDLNIEKLIEIYENQVNEVSSSLPADASEEQKMMKLPLGCDLNKAILVECVSAYLNSTAFTKQD